MDIPDLVPKSGDDIAPARSNEEKFLSSPILANQFKISKLNLTPSAGILGEGETALRT